MFVCSHGLCRDRAVWAGEAYVCMKTIFVWGEGCVGRRGICLYVARVFVWGQGDGGE